MHQWLKRHWKTVLLVYVASSLWWGPVAEAAFHLEHVSTPQKGLAIPATGMELLGIRTQAAPDQPGPMRMSGQSYEQQVNIAFPPPARCGGDLPSCGIMWCENKGKIRGKNPGSSASGKWQFVDGTWDGYGGYEHAEDAPEDVQDDKARELWDGGAGRGHWAQCL
jgi:hypothetical protein